MLANPFASRLIVQVVRFADIAQSKTAQTITIIASIASLAQSLGMDTTAEGVETHDELDLVRRHGCSHVQGYIYDAPLNFDAATERLQAGTKVEAQGPRSAREPRQKVLRRITLNHNGEHYNGMIRNISETGALIEGLWTVIGHLLDAFTPTECSNYFAAARYDAT